MKSFGHDERQDLFSYGDVTQDAGGISFHCNLLAQPASMNIYGKHQVMNALPCIYIARALGMSEAQILEGLADIEQTGLRCDLVALGAGYVLDDSYKSNRQSVLAALDTLCEFDIPRRIAVLSDMLDMGDQAVRIHYDVGKALGRYPIDRVCTYGEMSRFIAQGAINAGVKDVTHYETKEAAAGSGAGTSSMHPCILLGQGITRHADGQRRYHTLSKRQRNSCNMNKISTGRHLSAENQANTEYRCIRRVRLLRQIDACEI